MVLATSLLRAIISGDRGSKAPISLCTENSNGDSPQLTNLIGFLRWQGC